MTVTGEYRLKIKYDEISVNLPFKIVPGIPKFVKGPNLSTVTIQLENEDLFLGKECVLQLVDKYENVANMANIEADVIFYSRNDSLIKSMRNFIEISQCV